MKKITFLFGGETYEGTIVSVTSIDILFAIDIENVYAQSVLKYTSFTIIVTEVAPGVYGMITITSIHTLPFTYTRLLTNN